MRNSWLMEDIAWIDESGAKGAWKLDGFFFPSGGFLGGRVLVLCFGFFQFGRGDARLTNVVFVFVNL